MRPGKGKARKGKATTCASRLHQLHHAATWNFRARLDSSFQVEIPLSICGRPRVRRGPTAGQPRTVWATNTTPSGTVRTCSIRHQTLHSSPEIQTSNKLPNVPTMGIWASERLSRDPSDHSQCSSHPLSPRPAREPCSSQGRNSNSRGAASPSTPASNPPLLGRDTGAKEDGTDK